MDPRIAAMRPRRAPRDAPIGPRGLCIAAVHGRILAMALPIATMRPRRASMDGRIPAMPLRIAPTDPRITPMDPRITPMGPRTATMRRRIAAHRSRTGRQTVAKAASLSSIGVLSSSAMSFAFSSTAGRTLRAKKSAAATLPS